MLKLWISPLASYCCYIMTRPAIWLGITQCVQIAKFLYRKKGIKSFDDDGWMDNNAGLARSTRSRFPILVFLIRRLYIPQLEQLYQSIRGRLLTRTKSTGSFLPVDFLFVSFSDMWTNEPIMGVRNCFGDTRRYDKPPAKDIRKRLSRKWIENDGIPFNGIWTCECDPTTLYGFTVISIWLHILTYVFCPPIHPA